MFGCTLKCTATKIIVIRILQQLNALIIFQCFEIIGRIIQVSHLPCPDRFDAGAVTISDDLPNRILVGAITVHDNVSRFTSSGVVLDDGSIIEDLDIVVLATGFTYSFPFLDRDLVKVEDQFPHLYHLIFPPNVQPCTLAVIGLVQPFGSLPPILEMQV